LWYKGGFPTPTCRYSFNPYPSVYIPMTRDHMSTSIFTGDYNFSLWFILYILNCQNKYGWIMPTSCTKEQTEEVLNSISALYTFVSTVGQITWRQITLLVEVHFSITWEDKSPLKWHTYKLRKLIWVYHCSLHFLLAWV